MPKRPRKIAVITGTRAEYGLLHWVIRELHESSDLELVLIATGMHLSPEFGHTVDEIIADGFPIADRVEMLVSSDTKIGTAKSIGLGLIGFADSLARLAPDIVLVLGDRFEIFSAVSAATALSIPVAHIAGGELTFGANDDLMRHAITKMSHLHFAATEEYAGRIRQMGEEDWRVTVSGEPGLDGLTNYKLMSKRELQRSLGIPIDNALLVTFHPTTLEAGALAKQVDNLFAALKRIDNEIIFTHSNADAGGRFVIGRIEQFRARRKNVSSFPSLGHVRYLSLMKYVSAMAGNSSSGIFEAPSFGLPSVNIGTRQAGRIRAANTIDVGYDAEAIHAALRRALDPEFKRSLKGITNPYVVGESSKIIVETLRRLKIDERLIMKRFADRTFSG